MEPQNESHQKPNQKIPGEPSSQHLQLLQPSGKGCKGEVFRFGFGETRDSVILIRASYSGSATGELLNNFKSFFVKCFRFWF